MTNATVVRCTTCDGLIEVATPAVGSQAECPDCGALFVVASLEPFSLKCALEMDEDSLYEEDERSPV